MNFLLFEYFHSHSERAWGEDGYLAEKGMIPLPEDIRKTKAASVRALTPMSGKEPLK